MRDRSFAIFIIGSFLLCIPLQFYYTFTNLFLNEVGMEQAAAKMRSGQVSEIGFMLIMPLLLVRLGVKKMMPSVWPRGRFATCSSRPATPVHSSELYLGIVLHGICYDFFSSPPDFVDQKADLKISRRGQGFIAFVTLGAGMFIGAYASGAVVDITHCPGALTTGPYLDGPGGRRRDRVSCCCAVFFSRWCP